MKTKNMDKVSNENLQSLIEGLEYYRAQGIVDPWLLADGTTIEPLDCLEELQELRNKNE